MAGTLPPLFTISDDDHAGYVAVTSYTLLVLMIGLVATRVFTRWYIVRSIKPDDYFLVAAAVLATLQSVFVQLALDNGLGRRRITVSDHNFTSYLKHRYTAQILLIATIACAKISLSLLIQGLLAEEYSLLSGRGLLALIIGWSLSSMFALGFQCTLPKPWDISGRCLNLGALHTSIGAVNIITDILLVLLPCFVVWKARLSNEKRWGIIALFAARIIVCVVTGVQIHSTKRFFSSQDKTWSNTSSGILDQIAMSLSIIFTAIPSLGRLIVELQPAVNAFAITENHGGLRTANDRYALSSLAGRFPQEYVVSNKLGVHTSILGSGKGGKGKKRKGSGDVEDGDSMKGLNVDVLRRDVIRQTIDFKLY